MTEQELMGARIASMRTLRRMKQSDLARALGTSTQTISNWEAGARVPRADMVRALGIALNCTSDYILGLSTQTTK